MPENNDKSLKPTVTYSGENTLLIPCEPKEFGKFVSGLLGQTQSIHRRVKGPYEVTKSDVLNIYALIDQRLKRQNDSSIIEFSATTNYSDGSSVRVSSIQEFDSYAEVKPLISTDLTIQWKILVKFPHSSVPEKQEITISFITFREEDDEDPDPIFNVIHGQLNDLIVVRVEHTDRTWGADIENMLVAHMGLLSKPDSKWRVQAKKHAIALSVLTGAGITAASVWAIARASETVQSKMINIIGIKAGNATDSVSGIASAISAGLWEKFTLYSTGFLILSVITSVLIGIYMYMFLRRSKRSYVLLTKRSEDQKDKELRSRENNGYQLFGYILGSVIIGVLGNYAFAFAIKVWQP